MTALVRIKHFQLSAVLLFLPWWSASHAESSVVTCDSSQNHGAHNSLAAYPVTSEIDYVYSRPGTFSFLTHAPGDLGLFCKNSFRRDNVQRLGLIMAGSAVLFAFDQHINDEAKRFAGRIHLSDDNKTRTVATVAGFPIYAPANLGSALYYLGDGSVHFMITGSFLTFGLIRSDNRALQTSSQLAEGLITVGVATQILKHITGREYPGQATADRGVWRFFPNQVQYHKHISKYAAYPSGHLATAMMSVTVLADNYPNSRWIRPLGYSLMTVLGFQMLNIGVHWASDYPVGLAIGYTMAKIAVSRGRKIVHKSVGEAPTGLKSLCVFPIWSPERMGLALSCGM
jgi:hypothetical protein